MLGDAVLPGGMLGSGMAQGGGGMLGGGMRRADVKQAIFSRRWPSSDLWLGGTCPSPLGKLKTLWPSCCAFQRRTPGRCGLPPRKWRFRPVLSFDLSSAVSLSGCNCPDNPEPVVQAIAIGPRRRARKRNARCAMSGSGGPKHCVHQLL